MIHNYIKIAFRNLFKHKVYSVINIFGLAVGITCCLLITLYISNEWSFDKFHGKSDRIYRAWVHEDYGEGDIYFNTVTPMVLKPTLEENIPEVESVARRLQFADLVKPDEQSEAFSESLQLVDPSFFEIFDFEMLRGDPQTALSQPNQVVLSLEASKRYYGETDPMQQNLLIKMGSEFEAYTVSGIIENAPKNSSIRYQLLLPFEKGRQLFSEQAFTNWFSVSPETYVLLKSDVSPETVEQKFPSMMRQALGQEEYERSSYSVGLQPLTDIHLNTEMPVGIASVSDPTYSYILGAVALLILLIACVNFMTLSVSRSTSRAREVGIRKTVGAQRKHLMIQFWGEALLMTVMALGFGVILAELLLPYFNMLSGTSLSLDINGTLGYTFTVLAVFISLVAGIYPALILSGFRPVEVLKGKIQIKGDKSLF
ncbi:MAG: ABC transporter permease, partial [Balneolaceae bacterium]|nr:ABC transporter permease [Balneolaceae bacterium]